MRLPRPRTKAETDNTITLINIVFLMLIFFLIAGTLTPPLDPDVTLATTQDAPAAEPSIALAIGADGQMRWQGNPTQLQAFLADHAGARGGEPLKLAIDRELPAADLIDTVGALRAGGFATISVVTERDGR
jgi:biopolymer transport protein ExbD